MRKVFIGLFLLFVLSACKDSVDIPPPITTYNTTPPITTDGHPSPTTPPVTTDGRPSPIQYP